MNRFVFILGILWAATGAAGGSPSPLSPRNANYRIRAELNDRDKTVRGREILTWTNPSRVPARELRFHMYMNAFKNNRSTMMRELNGDGGPVTGEKAWGWIDIDSLKIGGGPECGSRLEFIRPDDANEDDRTVCRIVPENPVLPGKTVRIEIAFTVRLPRIFMRTGYDGDFFMVAQWFPKIGVFEEGLWNCHQFHKNTEFFADYGVYEVTVRLPRKYVVGAVGVLEKNEETDSTRTLTFRAEDVHDFSWTAWPGFKTAETTHRNVRILLLYDPDHASSVPRYFEAMKRTMDFFAGRIGPYPYPCVTIVDPPTGAGGAGGMEYPTLITAGSYWRMPRGIRYPEMVVTHEFGHAYWYGMVGSNEFEEAWLDEGINSYTEARVMDAWFGGETSVLDLPVLRVGELAYQRSAYIGMAREDRILRDAWTYVGGGYGTFSYIKPALMLKTFENWIGVEKMDLILKTYFGRWKFRHPRTADFLAVVREIAGPGYDGYFDQALNGSLELDYEVHSVSTEECEPPAGVFERNDGKVTLPEKPPGKSAPTGGSSSSTADRGATGIPAPRLYRSVITFHRNGEMIVPVDLLMVFEKGDTVRQVWDGKDRWTRWEFIKPVKLVAAEVDPERKIVLDSDFTNNSKTVLPERRPALSLAVRLLSGLQFLLHAAAFFT
jgi:hypothetical protein